MPHNSLCEKLDKIYEYSSVYAIGMGLYSAIEIIWRGHTHWTMALTGGICFTALYLINKKMKKRKWHIRCILGCSIITTIEFVVGCIVNLLLQMNVWDYSNRALNLFGQICPLFSLFWFLLCIPGFYACSCIEHILKKYN